mgnify:CR=1 FL=1
MLINFDEIIEVVLHHEGGYVNDPKDPGGETKTITGMVTRWKVYQSNLDTFILICV